MPDGLGLVASGALGVIAYVIISNTLWLMFGSRILQSMPGVNIPGVMGTLKIAAMVLFSILGVFAWLVKAPLRLLGNVDSKVTLIDEVAASIRRGARTFSRLRKS